MNKLKYFSLFSGIGGFELGIQRAIQNNVCLQGGEYQTENTTSLGQSGLESKWSKRLGHNGIQNNRIYQSDEKEQRWDNRYKTPPKRYSRNGKAKMRQSRSICISHTERCSTNTQGDEHALQSESCVGFSEIDKYASQIYKKHFPKHKEYGDVSKITWPDVEDFEMVVGGFPCQAFSIAGKRKGFNDTRGTLFFEIARCLREKQPRLLLLENVKGLLSHDKGNTFGTILNTLDELGYDLQWQVLNSKNFGVPQNRERVFIVGHLRGTSRPEVFPLDGFGMGKTHPAVCLTQRGYKSQRNGTYVESYSQATIGQDSQSIGDKSSHNNSIRRATYSDDMQIRRLTPTECERLQGFPDGWTEGVSDIQRYKCLGNAVTVNVIEAIMSKLILIGNIKN